MHLEAEIRDIELQKHSRALSSLCEELPSSDWFYFHPYYDFTSKITRSLFVDSKYG